MGLMRAVVPLVGLGMAAAGLDKLSGDQSYVSLYRSWGWSQREMRRAAYAEVVGGLLMAPRRTRPLGGVILGIASFFQLAAEVRNRDNGLAAARTGILGACVAALVR